MLSEIPVTGLSVSDDHGGVSFEDASVGAGHGEYSAGLQHTMLSDRNAVFEYAACEQGG